LLVKNYGSVSGTGIIQFSERFVGGIGVKFIGCVI